MTQAPSPFSEHSPKLQIAWDSTSLRALMFCPRSYEYSILQGWTKGSLDLEFGILAHSAFEVFAKARLKGQTRDQAQLEAVAWAICNSGTHDSEGVWVPWGGEYRTQWRCTGTEPYKNEKGNKAKCPLSHSGKWSDADAPSICGNCGSGVQTESRWVPRDKCKDREGLVRMISWYCDEQPEDMEQGVQPWSFPDGTPAAELSFKLPLPFGTTWGETFILCGHLDGVKKFGQELFVNDYKTTKKGLGKGYWAGYSPHVQVDTYDLSGSLLYQDLNLRGVMIEGVQLLTNAARFGKHVAYRSEALRQEYLDDLQYWLGLAETYALDDYWPMNRANCWLCGFKDVCSKDPSMREHYLKAGYQQRMWNPLEER